MSGRQSRRSRSKLMSARQCLKRLYLEVNRRELFEFPAQTEAALRIGNAIGDIAHNLANGH